MQPVTRLTLKIIGTISLVACVALFFWGRRGSVGLPDANAALRGEEVYSSHDCTDCHLGAHVLRQKRDKKEVGLIRVRKDFDVLANFLQTDRRHQSYILISEKDRSDLVTYLRTLVIP